MTFRPVAFFFLDGEFDIYIKKKYMYRFDFEIADLVWQVEMQMGRDGNRSFGLSGCFFLLF